MTDLGKQTKEVVVPVFHVKHLEYSSYPVRGRLSEVLFWMARHPRKNRKVSEILTERLVGRNGQ